MELLRFSTAGSVDDGKSTLIGRLLYDSKSILEDQLENIRQTSTRKGLEYVDLSLLTDGLKAEREQGITIDVAYRYFATPKRKFIIADTPGHLQYTRNMVTGASTADVALILIDARHGILEQTRRHTYIASLLRIPHLVACVNKMDLVDYSEARFVELLEEFKAFTRGLGFLDVYTLPISALKGDNVVNTSENMPWFGGLPLLHYLEHINVHDDMAHTDPRFPVQLVVRPHQTEFHDYRGYAGRVAGGWFRKGETVEVLPGGKTSTITKIHIGEKEVDVAEPGMSVSMELADDVDISRGGMLVHPGKLPHQANAFEAVLCWFNPNPARPGAKYWLRHTSNEVRAVIREASTRIDINTLEEVPAPEKIGMNDIVRVSVKTTAPLFFDPYKVNRITGSFILVDEGTNETVAAGLIM
jgi:sulfate adenylyltransferase subunit 1